MSELSQRLDARARAVGLALDAAQLRGLEDYLRLLARWNATINLTSLSLVGFPDATLDRLIVEALMGSKFIPSPSGRKGFSAGDSVAQQWFDLGSGGGSPAIPLKIVRPELGLMMVESKERKGAFLREVIRALGLTNTGVITSRIEDVFAVNVDIITVRAVSGDTVLEDAVARMLAPDGRLLLFGSSHPRLAGMEVEVEAPLVSTGDRLFVMKRCST